MKTYTVYVYCGPVAFWTNHLRSLSRLTYAGSGTNCILGKIPCKTITAVFETGAKMQVPLCFEYRDQYSDCLFNDRSQDLMLLAAPLSLLF